MRPHPDVVAAIRSEIPLTKPILLLGVTPELAGLCTHLLAVDRSEMMIGKLWPGNSEHKKVLQDDWLTMELPHHSFAAAIGDGSLNAVSYPQGHVRIYEQLRKFVEPGGQLVFRVYLTPDTAETLADLVHLCSTKANCSFQVFKWRLMMAMVAESGKASLAISEVWSLFQTLFPDRASLSYSTGWTAHDIDSIDVYRGSTEVYSFPTQTQLFEAIPPDFERVLKPVGSYELAERCPLVVIRLPGTE